MEPGFSETAAFTPPAVTFPNGCQVCEVEIDEDTGAVCIVRHAVVDDVGHMVNPMLVQGQIHGGIAQALGLAPVTLAWTVAIIGFVGYLAVSQRDRGAHAAG